jgi:hypothetical protein
MSASAFVVILMGIAAVFFLGFFLGASGVCV